MDHLPVCVHQYSMTPTRVCLCRCTCVCVSPSARRRHSLSLSPRLTVTGRDPSNYLFLDHMQMAPQCGERRLAEAAAGLMRLAMAYNLMIYHQNKCATSNRSKQGLTYTEIRCLGMYGSQYVFFKCITNNTIFKYV